MSAVFVVAGAHAAQAGINTWTSHGPYGGFVYALAIDPTTPSTLYAGIYSSVEDNGVYKSTDSGATWNALNTGLTFGYSVYSLAIDPTTPSTLYAGSNSDEVYKSTDSGASWSTGFVGWEVNALAIDPVTPSTLYAGTGCPGCLDESGEVYKSTDSGATWNALSTGFPVAVYSLAVDPTTPSTLYAGTYGYGVYKSTDSGASWSAVNNGLGGYPVSVLAIDPTTPSTLYAGTNGYGVYKSTNSGASWSVVNTGLPTYADVNALAIDPTTPSTLYAGTNGYGVYKSTDSGATWSPVNTGLTDYTHVNALAIDPSTPSTLYAGSDGYGVHKTIDGGASWTAVNTGLRGYGVGELAIDPRTPSTLYANGGGGVFKSTDSSATWNALNTALSGVSALAIDPVTPSTLYAGTSLHYAGTWGGGVYKSTDSGASWSAVNNGLGGYPVSVLAIDPTTPSTLYAGSDYSQENGVYKSTDSGASWSPVNNGLSYQSVHALVIDPSTPSTLYAGTDKGVRRSTDSGASWRRVDTGFSGDEYGARQLITAVALAIDPSTPSTLYAYTWILIDGGGPSWEDLYKSTNRGRRWRATGLSDQYVYALVIDPTTPSTLYAGTSWDGVFQSTDSGATWHALNTGLTYGSVYALAIDHPHQLDAPSTLYAGTDTGVFDMELVPPPMPALISGAGSSGCMLEWLTEPATVIRRNGLRARRLTCTDDNRLCDFGVATGDHACTFHVAVCLNVVDARLSCSPTDVAQVQLLIPKEAEPKDPTATANRDALENALTSIGGTVNGLCVNAGPQKEQLCAVNSDCDSTPGSGDGICEGRFVAFAPPLETDNTCTAFAPIQVPLKQTTAGFKRASATLRVTATSDPVARQKGHNSLKLTCQPHS